jgi:hypothetical protein
MMRKPRPWTRVDVSLPKMPRMLFMFVGPVRLDD